MCLSSGTSADELIGMDLCNLHGESSYRTLFHAVHMDTVFLRRAKNNIRRLMYTGLVSYCSADVERRGTANHQEEIYLTRLSRAISPTEAINSTNGLALCVDALSLCDTWGKHTWTLYKGSSITRAQANEAHRRSLPSSSRSTPRTSTALSSAGTTGTSAPPSLI